jgi:hypothetical protein
MRRAGRRGADEIIELGIGTRRTSFGVIKHSYRVHISAVSVDRQLGSGACLRVLKTDVSFCAQDGPGAYPMVEEARPID